MPMKRICCLLVVIFVCAGMVAQRPAQRGVRSKANKMQVQRQPRKQAQSQARVRYLLKMLQPVDTYAYGEIDGVEMYGGGTWGNGFYFQYTNGESNPARAVFNLGGQYDTMKLVLGVRKGSYGGNPRVVTIVADGNVIYDGKLTYRDIYKRITLNVKGVNELKFMLLEGNGDVCFSEITLWKPGETPKDTGYEPAMPKEKQLLIRDVMPYTAVNTSTGTEVMQHHLVSPNHGAKTVKLGNKVYDYGMILKMDVGLVGNNAAETHFNLNGMYDVLTFTVGPVNTSKATNGVGWITIMGDDKILYEYEIKQDDIAQQVSLNVSGVKKLTVASEQESHSLYGAIVDAWLYPKGQSPEAKTAESASGDSTGKLKQLPDVCKLISNIPPYALRGAVDHQLYRGMSEHVGFSIGGTRYSEGFILYQTAHFFDDNTVSFAAFDLGGEFDYVSFTTGFVGKSWVMNNDMLYVYADDKLILKAPLNATSPNQHYVLPINKCRKLRFENGGQTMMNVGAYGVADLVVYRGKPVENNLFMHPAPTCPAEVDLIDLGKPYLHYVYTMPSGAFLDGSTRRRYFTMPDGTRINKGFVLQTSTHFSLDHGVLSGTDNAAGAVVGATAVGASFVAGAAVGGTLVGSTLAGVAPLLLLAAGGEAVENSCIAFNTYGEYSSLTFTVACLKTAADSQLLGKDVYQKDNSRYRETLLVGADQTVVADLAVWESMQPKTVTIPINNCQQLMFWLSNTNGMSGRYVFYDVKLSKTAKPESIPSDMRQKRKKTK